MGKFSEAASQGNYDARPIINILRAESEGRSGLAGKEEQPRVARDFFMMPSLLLYYIWLCRSDSFKYSIGRDISRWIFSVLISFCLCAYTPGELWQSNTHKSFEKSGR